MEDSQHDELVVSQNETVGHSEKSTPSGKLEPTSPGLNGGRSGTVEPSKDNSESNGSANESERDSTIQEGGTTDEGSKPFEKKDVGIGDPQEETDHRRVITYLLIGLLAFMSLAYPGTILLMEWNGKKHEGLASAFNSLLPVVSGLVGSAVAYYFTRSQRR